jgi:hypothetical protein
MQRRTFIRLCAGGTVVGVAGCLPEDYSDGEPPVTGDEDGGGGIRIVDGGADGGGGSPPPGDAGGSPPPGADAGGGGPGSDAGPDCTEFVMMHDTHAQALYFGGELGPLTGIIYVDYVIEGAAVELEFWHGHGGESHRFTVGPADFEALKRGERVTLETTEVEGHTHMLFIDPTDESYRVDGAEDVRVPAC